VEASVGVGMETSVETDRSGRSGGPSLQVRLLGPLTIRRDGRVLPLPASRKVRALFAYLALSPQAVSRSQLCDLLWDVPDDPRGELRWCLSKIRGLVDGPGRRRVETHGDAVALDLADCFVDVHEIARAAREGFETQGRERSKALAALFVGDVLEGLHLGRSPAFDGWLAAQRRRLRDCHAALLEHLAASVPDDEALSHLESWLALAPFDGRVHGLLLEWLARRNRFQEAEEHLATTARLFEAEGLDHAPIRDAWRAARAQAPGPLPARPAPSADLTVERGDREDSPSPAPRRASIAVMPFMAVAAAGENGGVATALAHDVITRLAKLRSLFVIAQGTVFALHERQVAPDEAGRKLNVDYVVGGGVQRQGGRLTVSVELAETRTGHIIWAEIFNQRLDDTFLLLDEIGDRIVASIASEIETSERNRAILRPPNSLDAWEAHHRGLWHMYRFNKADNDRARHFFEMAVRLDPTFSRAYSGLSFTRFQNAFQGWADRERETSQAYEAAAQSLMADDRDPAAHWAMGRALWLRGRHDQSFVELEQAVDLSPNFAQGHYTLAFVHSQVGDPLAAIASSDHSRRLSPFDPMLFGMLGARAMALVRLGRFEEAADWAVKAATRPNAHAQILAIAAFSLALAGRLEEARGHLEAIRTTLPHYRIDDFLAAMQFGPEDARLFREGARRLGIG
jgi:DNA-binding SARP family transcriptional activator/TolB-like protein